MSCSKYVAEGSTMPCSFGGVVERDAVAAAADWYTYRIQQIIDALQ